VLFWELVLQFLNKIFYIIIILLFLSCKDIKRPDFLLSILLNQGKLGIITSDFSTSGRFYTLNEQGILSFNYIPIHSDATGFYFNRKIYIINRLNRDTIQVLNPDLFYQTILEFSTGKNSNPHGIAIYKNKGYITLYEKPYILVVDLNTGLELKKIDLSSYTDTVSFFSPDGIPEASGIMELNNKIYVALQRLDRTNPFQIFPVTDYSLLLEIDPTIDRVINQYYLLYKNPLSKLKKYNITGEDCIFVANAGNVAFNFAIDGAIEGFCPQSNSQFTLLKEISVGGDILDFVIFNANLGFALIEFQDFSMSIIKFNPLTGQVIDTILNYKNSGFAAGLEIYQDYLYIGESSRYPVIRVYSINSNSFINIIPLEQNPTDLFLVD
jgi:hypothetical protein